MSSNGLHFVSVVIPTYNRKKKVIRLIKSVLASTYKSRFEIIVVDDASTDGTYKEIQETFSENNVKIIRCHEEKLVAECRNIGLENSKGEFVFFIDDDVVVDQTTLSELVSFMQHNEKVGVAGPIVLYLNMPNVIWSAGIKENLWTTLGKFIGQNEIYGKFKHPIICDAIPTAFMVRRSIAIKLRFNSILFPIQFEEIDFCIRVNRAGYKITVIPWARVWHERPTATFLRSSLRTYFDVRNRFIRHKLWSINRTQYICSGFFSLFIPFIYIIISIKFSTDYTKTLKAILRGLKDGLYLSLKLKKSAAYKK